jgi:protease-4
MNKNTFSLLSSNWLLDEGTKAALMPFLFSIIKGTEIASNALNPTNFAFSNTANKIISDSDYTGLTATEDSVAIISVHHPIFKYDQYCGPKGTQSIINILGDFEKNPNIKGVVLDFNSGGGQASGCAEFFDYVNNYSKPIVSFTKDVLGSAAYYMAAGTDYIISHKHADFIGSVGTMFSSVDTSGALEKMGVKVIEEYSDLSPDKNKLSRTLAAGDTSVLIKDYLNPKALEFHTDVKSNRLNITKNALKGDVFSPENSLKEGLIDEIGTLQTAIDKVFSLSKTNTNANTNPMNKEIIAPSIQNALGYETPFTATDEGVFLQESEVDALEATLTAANTTATGLQAEIDGINALSTGANSVIDAALENAEIEFTPEMSISDKITLLNDQRNEFAGKTAKKTTKVVDDNAADKVIANEVGGYDITAAMNN